MKKFFDSEYVYLEIEDGILIGTYKKDLLVDLEVARKIVEQRLSFADEKVMPVLVINEGVKGINKEARNFLASPAGLQGITAGAIIIDSPVTSLLGNFYLQVNKPKIPTKLFAKKKTAINWLKQYKL
jgi:hypothetical protein